MTLLESIYYNHKSDPDQLFYILSSLTFERFAPLIDRFTKKTVKQQGKTIFFHLSSPSHPFPVLNMFQGEKT